ncbi:alkaline phosphatase D family protein [Streptomyces halobius]|uniref:Alkaline phosphatase D family protein n=1 Tax=Streptomyces halobius TaxID=2879846 RepID=A0ABY4MHX4_9ACTN|nr:alkaline phosphatase D family protein [Streptomyces halobius]UQA96010.1 alkaline phosphatase D family protein [Streptomyces halobius]
MTDHDQISRRTAVTAVAATAALLPFAGAATAHAQQAGERGRFFRHGIASGDPLPDGVLLWTRVTPTAEATPGSGRGPDTEVGWQVATDQDFASVVAHGSVTASAAADHTVKADVRGLRPATRYYYRFTVDGEHSPVGRTRTAPAIPHSPQGMGGTPTTSAGNVRFGVVSCANWESGYFSAYRHLAARTDLDAVLHLGDYLYEYKSGEFPDFASAVRPHSPAHELLTLADYRTRHGVHKTDPDALAMHAAHPVIAIWDDHEFADNAWSGGAVNHSPDTEGSWAKRMAAAKQAYFEWMPVRPSTAGTTYRRLRFGTLADLHLLDLRSFRDAQAEPGSGAVDDPGRTLTGRAQLDWLKAGLERSDAAWRLVGTSVMVSQVAFGSIPAYLLAPLAELLGVPKEGLAVNTDQWDGYTDDRRELLGHLSDRGIDNTVFLTGDIHMAWANDVPLKAATYPVTAPVATEFVVTSVTSDNVDDFLHVAPHTVSLAGVAAIRAANRHVKWLDMDSHGYGVLDVTAERTQMDFFGISDRTDPNATSELLRSYRTRSGTQRVERADRPVG